MRLKRSIEVATKKDPKYCGKCQRGRVEYMTTHTGRPLKHGVCRDCHERSAGSGRTSNSGARDFRTEEQKENTYETKFGTGHS